MKDASVSSWIRRNHQAATLVILLLVSSVSIYLSGDSRLTSPAQLGLSVIGVVQELFSGVYRGVTGLVGSIGELAELRQRYQELLTQVQEFQGTERIIAELRAENQRLRELLQFQESFNPRLLPALVVSRDPTSVTNALTIDRGHLHGVKRNDVVIAHQGKDYGLVGRVIAVGFTTSQVQPIVNPSNYVAARFQKSRHEGLVVGDGTSKEGLRMMYVRKQALDEVQAGDLVVTSGLGSLYPRGLPIGRVIQIFNKTYETTIEIELAPAVDFHKLEYVFVLSQQGASNSE